MPSRLVFPWKTTGFLFVGSRVHKPGVAGSSPAAASFVTERLVLGQPPAVFRPDSEKEKSARRLTCPHEWNQVLSSGLPCQGIAPVRLLRRSRSERTAATRLRGRGAVLQRVTDTPNVTAFTIEVTHTPSRKTTTGPPSLSPLPLRGYQQETAPHGQRERGFPPSRGRFRRGPRG